MVQIRQIVFVASLHSPELRDPAASTRLATGFELGKFLLDNELWQFAANGNGSSILF